MARPPTAQHPLSPFAPSRRQGKRKDGIAEVQRFHRRLCELRVLDPAYGSGNFLTSRSSS